MNPSQRPPASPRIALVYPGDAGARSAPTPESSRFLSLFQAIEALDARAEPAVYHDDYADEVRHQLLECDAVLVWVNPIEGGRDRSVLDDMLRDVASHGVFVSAHPDVILKLGTKEVLYRTRELGWGCDTHLYRTIDSLRDELPARLASGPRVLKQYRGNGGNGVWKVESAKGDRVLVRHAKRGSVEETLAFDEFVSRCQAYFAGEGRMIDQVWQPRLPDGMVRCYLVHGRVEGFGLQAINALYPPPPGAPAEAAPQPGPRLYQPPTLPACQSLKNQLEREWVPQLRQLLDIDTSSLPVLWDCDFMLGPKTARGEDTYVLCEINVSSVSPFPESAVEPVARAALVAAQGVWRRHR